ncbi:putative bifunctional diguanylate cyclase/phosphodiesterase [Massilia sp. LXY-6]|uniref:putative bifunctional diguanylate cyclase/phosphodiesterase n=1 Tax=Massilia sp. LXY-6 TaxID=3379823 RepID=UPI003EDED2BB
MEPNNSCDMQRHYNDLLQHLPAGVVVHGPDGRIRSANPLAEELLGWSEAELIDVIPSASRWGLLRSDNSLMLTADYPIHIVMRTGEKVRDLVVGRPATQRGPERWLICNAYPEFGADGRLEQIVVCFTDCSALKRAEQNSQKLAERLRLVLQGSNDASWDWNLITGEIYYSERWWAMLGYEPGSLPSTTDLWCRLAHPDDKKMLHAFVKKLLVESQESYAIEFRMRHKDGHSVPVLSRGFVSRDPNGKALRLSGTNTDLTERKQAEQRIYEAAYFDHLTGLPNRRFLSEELHRILARSARSGQIGALLFLDLDNFKLLNDTMGHDVGDALLRQVAQRLRHTLRHSDQLSRLGGDEFVVVLEDLGLVASDAVAEVNNVVGKILDVLGQPCFLDGRQFFSTTSIGVTLFDGITADIEALLKQADLAMYQAKADGRNAARFFDPRMQATADRQAALEGALRDGLSMHEFVLFCQPQFKSRAKLVGAEVLVRWHRRDGALLSPAEFIDLAESSGLIVPLGQHILEKSCMALARWAKDRTLRKLKLAVNVSVQQLRSPEFPATVADILEATHAPADRLWLELTENVFAENMAEISQHMRQLCDQGIRFSLDDFGTGYSSLAYLRNFPLAALKIDRSFVRDVHTDPSAASIVKAIIALARNLKLDIVAEGVEHEPQRIFLIEGGCHTIQGYLLGAPMPIEEFEYRYGVAGAASN